MLGVNIEAKYLFRRLLVFKLRKKGCLRIEFYYSEWFVCVQFYFSLSKPERNKFVNYIIIFTIPKTNPIEPSKVNRNFADIFYQFFSTNRREKGLKKAIEKFLQKIWLSFNISIIYSWKFQVDR